MLVWNDLDADEKIKVYDKGVEIKNGENGDNAQSPRLAGELSLRRHVVAEGGANRSPGSRGQVFCRLRIKERDTV